MKTTRKVYLEKLEEVKNLSTIVYNNTLLIRQALNTVETDREMENAEAEIQKLNENYFDKLETVFIEYWIGCRKYAESVYKIGKSYFDDRGRITKSKHGYKSIVEVDGISDNMRESMIADSYYY